MKHNITRSTPSNFWAALPWMTESAVERFELIAGEALEAFGYERSQRNPRIGNRAVVGARRSYLEVKKLSRRIRGLSSGDWI